VVAEQRDQARRPADIGEQDDEGLGSPHVGSIVDSAAARR
jgi:hypothetical protein